MISAQIAKRMYNKYYKAANGVAHTGAAMPTWENLPEHIRGYWVVAAEEARDAIREGLVLDDFERQQIAHAIHFAKNFASSRISGSNGFLLLAKLCHALRL